MKTEQKDVNQLWAQFKIYLRGELGWYQTMNYQKMTGPEFVKEYGDKMSAEFRFFMLNNVQIVSRQCDDYAIYFVGEEIPK
jgi:hypothetical protein